jgi:hypothetical protein
VQSDARRAQSKLTDPELLVDLGATLPFEPHLRIETTRMPPEETATQIARHFALPVLDRSSSCVETTEANNGATESN